MNTCLIRSACFAFKIARCAAISVLITIPALCQIEEPILTKSAQVFDRTSGSLKLDFTNSMVQSGASSQIIPEFTLQAGISERLEGILRFPLLRVDPGNGPPFIAGGQLAAGAKYLIWGRPGANAAIAIQGVVEAPTGDSRLEGNATQLMPQLLVDWRVKKHIVSFTNVGWDLSVGGTSKRISLLTYETAAGLDSWRNFMPAVEFAGSTNATTGRTIAVLEPDVLFRRWTHFELKLGLPAGINSKSPTFGLHAQVAMFWGGK